ncbi:MAG: glycosyltransferase family 4 protein [Candidatus Moranbacteria bacterium]|nr:glycosyltransferase family 4 protein [Candidatus Moranbacteria bacterium]MDD3965051.1 glycosyltransferase family 4 protein [Candidatus Moranbacteria bacterium]
MKILVIAPTPFFSDRGTHIRILEEALALEKRGHTVMIATYHIGQDIPKSLESHIDIRRIRRLLFWYKKLEAGPDWQKLLLDLMLLRKTFYLARTWRPDIIHGHLHEGVLIGALVKKFLFWRKLKLVADFHGSLTNEMVSHSYLKAMGLQKIFRMIEHSIDGLGDRTVASSWDNVKRINEIPRMHQAELLLDGVRLSMFDRLPESASLREIFHIPQNKVIVTYTGALIPNKGIKLLLEAIPLVCKTQSQVHFVIAGFPVDQIASYMQEQSFQEHVTVISPLPYFDLAKILHLSDIGVDPKESSTNQASGKMLQYMGAGLPIVCFDTENNRQYLADGGVYAREVTKESLAEALGTLLSSESLRKEKGASNRARAERFGWEVSAEKLEKMYQEIV